MSERRENLELLRRVRDVVPAADHVRDPVVHVLDRVGEVIGRPAVASARARRPRASRSAPRSCPARRRPTRSRLRRASGSGSRPRPRMPCRRRGGCWASSRQRSIASSWKRDRPVPVDPEPRERALDLLRRLRHLAARVGVLDPQQALAAPPAGEQPVEQERAHAADVQEARWGSAPCGLGRSCRAGSRRSDAADPPDRRDQQHAGVQGENRTCCEPGSVRDADSGREQSGSRRSRGASARTSRARRTS